MYSLWGFRYCDWLLGIGRYEDVLERAEFALEISKRNNWLLAIAFDHLSLGRAFSMLFQKTQSPIYSVAALPHLDTAVAGLEKAGQHHHIPLRLPRPSPLPPPLRCLPPCRARPRCRLRPRRTQWYAPPPLRLPPGVSAAAAGHGAKRSGAETSRHRRAVGPGDRAIIGGMKRWRSWSGFWGKNRVFDKVIVVSYRGFAYGARRQRNDRREG